MLKWPHEDLFYHCEFFLEFWIQLGRFINRKLSNNIIIHLNKLLHILTQMMNRLKIVNNCYCSNLNFTYISVECERLFPDLKVYDRVLSILLILKKKLIQPSYVILFCLINNSLSGDFFVCSNAQVFLSFLLTIWLFFYFEFFSFCLPCFHYLSGNYNWFYFWQMTLAIDFLRTAYSCYLYICLMFNKVFLFLQWPHEDRFQIRIFFLS